MTAISCLVDNTPSPDGTLDAEHGLSFWIERESTRVLFDTGRSSLFMANARRLGVDPLTADHVVISHGHYDHADGLPSLFGHLDGVPLWLGTGFFTPKWSIEPDKRRYIGSAWSLEDATKGGFDVKWTGGADARPFMVPLAPGLWLAGGFPRLHGEETIARRMQCEEAGTFRQDFFNDEHALVIDRGKTLALVVGCAHPGLMNMLEAVESLAGRPVSAVFGGSHLVEADEARIGATISFLSRRSLSLAALGHCTGAAALAALSASCPAWRPLHGGARFVLDGTA